MQHAHHALAFRLVLLHWHHLVVERQIKWWNLAPFLILFLAGLPVFLRYFLFIRLPKHTIISTLGNDCRKSLPLGTAVGP